MTQPSFEEFWVNRPYAVLYRPIAEIAWQVRDEIAQKQIEEINLVNVRLDDMLNVHRKASLRKDEEYELLKSQLAAAESARVKAEAACAEKDEALKLAIRAIHFGGDGEMVIREADRALKVDCGSRILAQLEAAQYMADVLCNKKHHFRAEHLFYDTEDGKALAAWLKAKE